MGQIASAIDKYVAGDMSFDELLKFLCPFSYSRRPHYSDSPDDWESMDLKPVTDSWDDIAAAQMDMKLTADQIIQIASAVETFRAQHDSSNTQ